MTEEVQNVTKPSTKRELTATVASTAVGVLLSIGTSILVSKVTKRVHDKIAPEVVSSTDE